MFLFRLLSLVASFSGLRVSEAAKLVANLWVRVLVLAWVWVSVWVWTKQNKQKQARRCRHHRLQNSPLARDRVCRACSFYQLGDHSWCCTQINESDDSQSLKIGWLLWCILTTARWLSKRKWRGQPTRQAVGQRRRLRRNCFVTAQMLRCALQSLPPPVRALCCFLSAADYSSLVLCSIMYDLSMVRCVFTVRNQIAYNVHITSL